MLSGVLCGPARGARGRGTLANALLVQSAWGAMKKKNKEEEETSPHLLDIVCQTKNEKKTYSRVFVYSPCHAERPQAACIPSYVYDRPFLHEPRQLYNPFPRFPNLTMCKFCTSCALRAPVLAPHHGSCETTSTVIIQTVTKARCSLNCMPSTYPVAHSPVHVVYAWVKPESIIMTCRAPSLHPLSGVTSKPLP